MIRENTIELINSNSLANNKKEEGVYAGEVFVLKGVWRKGMLLNI